MRKKSDRSIIREQDRMIGELTREVNDLRDTERRAAERIGYTRPRKTRGMKIPV